ncbi:MAG TPA: hypothetical protein VFN75_02540 [Pseudonocardiaceae bacterium]|nr:hypothetical protein [Pseudonocardiaceae bacterium]
MAVDYRELRWGWEVSSTAREVRPTITANGGEAASLVESAMLLRWRAPELALLLADRAVTAAQDDRIAVLRADHLAVFALNHLGRHGEAAHRLFPAIQDADASPALRHELHVELAHCAVAVGEPVTALDAVYAVLAAGDDVAAVLRGEALVTVAEAALALGRNDLVTSALEEADELYREDPSLDRDTALLLRAAVRATDAARHRGRGATAEAEAKSREGRELLVGLADPDHDSGEVSARLTLELVLTLIGRGAGETAMQEVRPLLRRPVRAAAASSVGRLRLALATQVHLAEGRHEPALTLLADAVEGAQRYGVDAVLAECLEGLSHVHEARDEFADALHCMRAARAAEARHRRDLAAARSTLLENCGFARHVQARLLEQVTELLTPPGTGCAGLDPDSATLHADRVQAAALEEVTGPPVAEVELAEVELAEAVTCQPSTSTAESNGASTAPVGLPAAVLPVAEEPTAVHDGEPSSELDPWQSRARHRRGGEGTLVSVSDLLPASAMSAGRSGRRRAGESAERNRDETHEVEKQPPVEDGSGQVQPPSDLPPSPDGDAPEQDTEAFSRTRPDSPPPAPTPRTLEWEPADGEAAPEGDTPQMGLGDLLAEALAAYQKSRDVRADARPTGMSLDDASATADVETSIDLPRYRGSRWTAGLVLAPSPTEPDPTDLDPSDADGGDPPEVVTNPLLRLPNLTTEPRWVPPETRRRSAAGD